MPDAIFDAHAHHVGEDALAVIERDGAPHGVALVPGERGTRVRLGERTTGLPVLGGLLDVDARLRWMEQAGVERQLVCGWMDLAGYHLPPSPARWLATLQNDALAALVARHPDRFVAAAMVPLGAVDAAVAELRRAVVELGHRAVQIGTRVEERGLDDPELEPFWAEVERLNVPVLVHPAELDVPERVRRLFLQILVGNPSDTTMAAGALLLGGVLERHPALRVVLVHGGGFLPYQLGRMEVGFTRAPAHARPRATQPPSAHLHQLYYDTILHDESALRHLLDVAGADHVVTGSDYPFPMRDDRPGALLDVVLPDPAARRAVAAATAHALLASQAMAAGAPEDSWTISRQI